MGKRSNITEICSGKRYNVETTRKGGIWIMILDFDKDLLDIVNDMKSIICKIGHHID